MIELSGPIKKKGISRIRKVSVGGWAYQVGKTTCLLSSTEDISFTKEAVLVRRAIPSL